jgi:nicotinamidase/pyrazinamidase
MHPVAFFDVDTQFDFMDPAGALHVKGADEIWRNLKKLTEFAVSRDIPVIASADAHDARDPEFQEFPSHCVKGSTGAARIPETRLKEAVSVGLDSSPRLAVAALGRVPRAVIEKKTFDVFSNPAAEAIVRAVGARDWVVYGVATDYCVRAAAIGLRQRDLEVTVVTDAVKGIVPAGEAKALEEMKAAGVRFITTDVLLKALERAPAKRAARGPKGRRRGGAGA